MVISLFLPIHVWNIFFIRGILFDTLVYQSGRKLTCLEKKYILLTVPSTRMPSYVSATMSYHFIDSISLLHIIWFIFTMSMEDRTQRISYQSIGANQYFGTLHPLIFLNGRYHGLDRFGAK